MAKRAEDAVEFYALRLRGLLYMLSNQGSEQAIVGCLGKKYCLRTEKNTDEDLPRFGPLDDQTQENHRL